ncbi:hypothetical protein M0R01_04940, partial [bacterium]|nr:hypothetical protein [bacterium]
EAVVTGLTFKRTGVGATADWSDLYLYEGDTRITPVGRTLSSDTHTVEFTALSITVSANSSKIITLRGDILCTGAACATTHATASDQHAFSLTGVETTATVTGLPVAGNTMVIGSQNIGTATVAVGTTPNAPAVGQLAAEVASFKVTNDSSNNDITFDQLVLTFTGSIARSGLTNFKLYQAGETVVLATASGIASNDTLTLTLTTPFTILKGQNRSFSLKADVAGRVAETAKFFIDQDNHIVVTDKQYGFGAKVTNNYATGNAPTLTLKGGTITFADNGPTVGNIGKNQQDVVLTKFSLTPNRSVEVRRLTVTLCADNDATFNNADGEVADLRIKDADTGTTLMSGTVSTVGIGRCAVAHDATLNPITYSLTNAFNASAGITKHLAITVDLAADTVNHMTTAGLKLRANLGMTVYDATHSYIRDTATGDYIVTTDIVPTTITGDDQTVLAASLTPTIASTPVTGTFVKGSTDVSSMGITLTATDAAAVNVRRIKAWVYAEDDTTFAADESYNPSTIISSVKLYEEGNTTPLATRSISYTTGTDYGEVDFDGLNINVVKGTNKKLTFKTDLSTSGSAYPYYYYIGVDNDNITAYDADGNLLTITGDTNTGIAPSVYITVSDGGTLTLAKDAASPADDIVIAGTSNVVMSKFKFTANTEDITVDKLRIDIGSSTSSRSVTAVKMAYTGGTATGYLSSGYVTFSGMNWLIKKDTSSVLTVSADLNTTDLGATSGDAIELGLACSTASNCNVIGASGTVLGDAGAELSNVDGNTMYIRKTRPTVALATGSATGSFVPGWTDVGTWTISADAAEDVDVDGVKFTLETNGTSWKGDITTADFRLYDTSNLNDDLLDNGESQVAVTYATSTGILTVDWVAAYRQTAPKGSSKSFLLKVDTLSSATTAYAIDQGLGAGLDAYLRAFVDTDSTAGATGNLVWYDKVTGGAAINGYLVKTLPAYSNGRTYDR